MSRAGWSVLLVALIGCASRQRTLPELPPPPPVEEAEEEGGEPDYSELPPPPKQDEATK